MSEEGRRVSTTPIPVPVPFYAQQAMAQPTQTPLAAPPVPPAAAAAAAAAAATIENPTTTATENNMTTVSSAPKDVTMTDAEPSSAASPAVQQGASPAPNRTGTPARATNGVQEQQASSTSRAASAHPDPGFTMQSEAPLHGAPVRQYLNTKVTGAVLEGMKIVAKEQPKDPLRVLGEFLLQRSKELESSA
ncbi:dpy-30 domain-containing protein [Pestalotiopsis sp. NC0098]|nr:dpy-30 domain-containing protein [Pestalotiopsis sp. NC0098]